MRNHEELGIAVDWVIGNTYNQSLSGRLDLVARSSLCVAHSGALVMGVPSTQENHATDSRALKLALQFHAGTRFAVGFITLVMLLIAWALGWIPSTKIPGFWIAFVLATAILASTTTILLMVHTPPAGKSAPILARSMELKPSTRRFPLPELVADFVALALLVMLTGGIESVFLPLFVIGLILSDISLEHDLRRNSILWVFVLTSVPSVLVPLSSQARCVFIGEGGGQCLASIWALPSWAQALSGLFVFLAGALLGSFVLRGYIGRTEPKKPGNDK